MTAAAPDYSPAVVLRALGSIDDPYASAVGYRHWVLGEGAASIAASMGRTIDQVVETSLYVAGVIAAFRTPVNPSGGLYTPGDRALLKAAIEADQSLSTLRGQALQSALNKPAGMVPAPFTVTSLLAGMVAVSKSSVMSWPGLPALYDAASRQDRSAAAEILGMLADAGRINRTADLPAALASLGRMAAGGPLKGELIAGWASITTMADIAAIGKDK